MSKKRDNTFMVFSLEEIYVVMSEFLILLKERFNIFILLISLLRYTKKLQ